MKIGNVETENNVFLAPMAGITDMVFRILCKEQGAGLVYSEMISAKGIMYNSQNTKKLLQSDQKERPISVQLFGSDPEILAQQAKSLKDTHIDIIDINMGCPAPKIVRNGEGSALMKNPELIGRIVYSVKNATDKPLSVKIRKGFDNDNINAVEVAKIAEKNGADLIAVHPRTTKQYYQGKADWNIIKDVKDAVNIPVVGSGDITTPLLAKEMLDLTNCDGIMIGRGAEGDPWIFKRVLAYLNDGILLPEPTVEERINMAIRHFNMLIDYKGEYTALNEIRKHLGWYIKGINGAAKIRHQLNILPTKDEIISLLNTLLIQNTL